MTQRFRGRSGFSRPTEARAGGAIVFLVLVLTTAATWVGCGSGSGNVGFSTSGAGGAGPTGTGAGGGTTSSTTGHTTTGHPTTTTTTTTTTTGAGGMPVTCSQNQTKCEGSCTSTQFDPANCGKCGNACAAGQVCSLGKCASVCAAPSTVCGGMCVDPQSDPANCGKCGNACAAGQVCSKGACGLVCAGGSTQCGQACVDVQNDPQNCGKCANACLGGELCSGGSCALSCGNQTTQCGMSCANLQNDPANCGKCGNACPGGQVCSQALCALSCQGGTVACNGSCVDTANDPANCGACAKACAVGQVCSMSVCAGICGGGLSKCGNTCVDTTSDRANCGGCGVTCVGGDLCTNSACVPCDSNVMDCDGDGWKVSDGDCCDKPGLCGSQPELVNPGAIEVVGNGIDDNCNGLVDLFDTVDTLPCDAALLANSQTATDYAKAIGLCRTTTLNAPLPTRTWGLIDAQLLQVDGTPMQDFTSVSIRGNFGNTILPLQGSKLVVLSNGIASDATQTNPGPNGGAPNGTNVSNTHNPAGVSDIGACAGTDCVKDWFSTANPPLKNANELPVAPNCGAGNQGPPNLANDSTMLRLTIRAPTNAKAFSFNSFFMSAEYPEFVCSNYNDQFIALVDTPNGVPALLNPIDKNLMTYIGGGQRWPIGINIANGTSIFSVCDSQAANAGCWNANVNVASCSLGSMDLTGTGFEAPLGNPCTIGGGTFWLTTAGNVVPGQVMELRIAVWDVGDSIYDSLALVDGFQWLANATLPGTGN